MKRDLIANLYISTHGNQNQADDELLQKMHPVHAFVHCFLCYIKRQNKKIVNRKLTGDHIETKCIPYNTEYRRGTKINFKQQQKNQKKTPKNNTKLHISVILLYE